jgi:hypothetical protein
MSKWYTIPGRRAPALPPVLCKRVGFATRLLHPCPACTRSLARFTSMAVTRRKGGVSVAGLGGHHQHA